jgi:two-component system response regulator HydG
MVVFDTDGILGVDDVQEDSPVLQQPSSASAAPSGPASLVGRPLAEVERYYAEQALALAGNNREEAARTLGIGERTLYRNIQEWKQLDRIKQVLGETNGDVGQAAGVLEMDAEELRAKIKKYGLG